MCTDVERLVASRLKLRSHTAKITATVDHRIPLDRKQDKALIAGEYLNALLLTKPVLSTCVSFFYRALQLLRSYSPLLPYTPSSLTGCPPVYKLPHLRDLVSSRGRTSTYMKKGKSVAVLVACIACSDTNETGRSGLRTVRVLVTVTVLGNCEKQQKGDIRLVIYFSSGRLESLELYEPEHSP